MKPTPLTILPPETAPRPKPFVDDVISKLPVFIKRDATKTHFYRVVFSDEKIDYLTLSKEEAQEIKRFVRQVNKRSLIGFTPQETYVKMMNDAFKPKETLCAFTKRNGGIRLSLVIEKLGKEWREYPALRVPGIVKKNGRDPEELWREAAEEGLLPPTDSITPGDDFIEEIIKEM